MKTVFDNRMVAHVWAQQTQHEGRSHNGNFWFEGDTIYSYRTMIARFVETVTGGKVALVNERSYSHTTSGKHKPAIWRALDYQGFSVPSLTPLHEVNQKYLETQYADEVARLRRMRDAPVDYTWERLGKIADTATEYAAVFGLPVPQLNSVADRTAIEQFRAERDARNNTPAKIAAKARKAERETARLAAMIADFEGAWRRNEVVPMGRLTRYQRREFNDILRQSVMMRVHGEDIETSLGARFPIEHGKRAFAFIMARRDQGQAWARNGHAIHLGHFVIDSIDAEGNVRAGCHFVKWQEIERMARELGLLPPASQAAA